MSRSAALRRLRGWVRRRAITVPSWPPSGRRVRLLALLAARDEMRFLPGYFASVGEQVDGVVALDDGSGDGTAEYLASRPEVVEVLRHEGARGAWDETGNYRRLVGAALRHHPDWLVSLDADERVEIGFRGRAERVIRRGARLGWSAFAVRLLELWDGPHTYRSDGVWRRKCPPRLFRARADHIFDDRALHAGKAPLQAKVAGTYPVADLIVYHLRMIRREDREARRRRYEAADPGARWQPGLGYAYLTDESGLRLRRVPRGRSYVDAEAP
ncbi:MAG: glycosyltransferase family 2 protein [Thermoanaerobaculales bacterium]|jgi:hypothetical protein|nr:glycosyltransferase family 2 protein [Thermoanaerobaculales bacterium]